MTLDGQRQLEVTSCPIKVVSKPEQIRRKRKEANQEPDLEGWKKRARSEDVLIGLRSIESKLSTVLNDVRDRQALLANVNTGSETGLGFLSEEDDDASSWTEEDFDLSNAAAASYGEPSSFVSCDDTTTNATLDLSGEDVLSTLVEFEPSPKRRACLATAFEDMLHSYASLYSQQQAGRLEAAEPIQSNHSQIQRLHGLFSLIGLPQSLELDEFH